VVTIVTDNGGPFRFEAFIELHPELHHVRTRVNSPGQNGSRERGFGTMKYERLFIDEIDDAVMLAKHAEEYRIEYNQIRPHEAIAWNRPQQVHLGLADPTTPTFQTTATLPTSLTRNILTRLCNRDLVDEVLIETRRLQERSRLLPARVVVYYVMALTLFFDDSYEEVIRRLVDGLRGLHSFGGRIG
jgi:Insertion element 4 transposase N-terminal/Integrase core domain